DELKRQIQSNTKAIFIETPTNPLMTNIDMTAVSHIAKANNLFFIVDNTVYTPYIQKPLDDETYNVIQRATKYTAGHNDDMKRNKPPNDIHCYASFLEH